MKSHDNMATAERGKHVKTWFECCCCSRDKHGNVSLPVVLTVAVHNRIILFIGPFQLPLFFEFFWQHLHTCMNFCHLSVNTMAGKVQNKFWGVKDLPGVTSFLLEAWAEAGGIKHLHSYYSCMTCTSIQSQTGELSCPVLFSSPKFSRSPLKCQKFQLHCTLIQHFMLSKPQTLVGLSSSL